MPEAQPTNPSSPTSTPSSPPTPPQSIRQTAAPPPEVAKRPRRQFRTVGPAAADPQPPTPPPSTRRELPSDPGERRAARATVSTEADTIIAILSGVASQLPPGRPFSNDEKAMIEIPLQDTLYKYGGNVDPAISLAIALGTIAFMRWSEFKMAQATKEAKA